MNWKEFFKPDGKKILLFLVMLIIAPFPYFTPSESVPEKIQFKVIWGFPPLILYIYDYLPDFFQEINIGIFQISKVKVTYLWMPVYSFFIYILSCSINKNLEEIKKKYGITTFKGILWKKLREGEKIEETHEKIQEKEKKILYQQEKAMEEVEEEKIKEREKLIEEQEELIKEEKEELRQEIDQMNTDKLREMGLDIKENLILCSGCNEWKPLTEKRLLKLIEKKGFGIIWKYRCTECKRLKK